MIKRSNFFIVIFLCAILCVSLVGCDCGCSEDRQDIEPYEVTYRLLMKDENGTRYDRLDVLKYSVDGQVMTVYYSYHHGIVDIEMSGASGTETSDTGARTTQSSEDSGSILGQDSYFEY